MPSSLDATVREVQHLKGSLLKEYEKKSSQDDDLFDPRRCLDLLANLDSLPINLQVLTETLIGTAVSKFKSLSGTHDEVATSAKMLVKKWKKLAKDQLNPPDAAGAAQASTNTTNNTVVTTTIVTTASSIISSHSYSSNRPEEWNNLAPLRRNVRVKLLEVLSVAASANQELMMDRDQLIKTVSEVEEAIQRHSRGDKQAYGAKARQLNFNFKKNQDLCVSVLSGDISPTKLTEMSSQELCSSELAKQREEDVSKLQESRRLDWEQANEHKINEMCGIKGDLLKASLFTCGRCKSIKTTSTQKQTRSADEPMTVFVLCTNCGNRWKIS